MQPFNFVRWLKSLVETHGNTVENKRRYRLSLEQLETRLAPASFVWSGGGGAINRKISAGVNWVGGVAPTGSSLALDDLVFPSNAPLAARVVQNDLIGAVFNSLTIGSSNYALSGNKITLGTALSSGGFVTANAGAINNSIAFDIQMGGSSQQFFTVQTNANLTFSGKLSGSAGLTKTGAGTLILTNNNSTFTGQVKIENDAGIVRITNAAALGGTTAGTTVGTNSQLQVSNVTGAISENLILNGPGSAATGALYNLAGNNTWAGTITLDSNSTIGAAAGSLNITGVISDLGAGHNLIKAGAGQIILSAANTYRGTTTINNGILTIRHAQALGEPTPGGAAPSLANATIVNANAVGTGTLQLEAPTGSNGFSVQNELLVLNGAGFTGLGAMHNLKGNNTWAGDVILGSPVPNGSAVQIGVAPSPVYLTPTTDLLISGVIDDPNATMTFKVSLTKILGGRLIFDNHNTYFGETIIAGGILAIRDSHGLGNNRLDGPDPNRGDAEGTTVRSGASLQLEVDNILDSTTLTTNTLRVDEDLRITGHGFDKDPTIFVDSIGALDSLSGINIYAGDISIFGSHGSIGVEPDLSPNSDNSYFTDDYSLTVTGDIGGTVSDSLFKLGTGQLILPNANTYTGGTVVEKGWVTIQDEHSLGAHILGRGDTAQPPTRVEDGAAIHIKPLTASSPALTIAENFILNGLGITHPFALINKKGVLMNLGGDNVLTGDLKLAGTVGIGSELLETDGGLPAGGGELTTKGSVSDYGPSRFAVAINPTGTSAEDRQLIDTGSNTGSITVTYDMFFVPDQLRIYYPPQFQGGALIYDTGLVSGTNTFTVAYGPGPSTFVELIMNEGGGLSGTAWVYSATVNPTGAPKIGGITKFGSKRLTLQGDGTYSGEVDVKEGVLRTQNDSGLGSSKGGTTLRAGTALEVTSGVAELNGGISEGIQVWDEKLTVIGQGNTSVNGGLISPLTIMAADSMWRGPVTLQNSVVIDVQGSSRFTLFGAVDDATNLNAAGSSITKAGSGKLVLAGANSYRGTTFVNSGIVNIQSDSALGAVGATRGTIVANGASLELQGNISVGETLTIQGTGVGNVPPTPSTRWFQQGPAPIQGAQVPNNTEATGRITGVTVDPSDPNVIYISAAGGGAWKTKDGGKSWLPLFDSQKSLFSGAIAVAPSDPRVIYLGTGETNNSGDSYYGTGVYKSTDSGKTWTLLTFNGSNPLNRKSISRVVVDPDDPNLIYAASSDQSVYSNTGNVGVWRYDGSEWYNLTAVVPPGRLTPGPIDNAAIDFPQSGATWSDLLLMDDAFGGRFLFAALGTSTGSAANAVYRCLNPTSFLPLWNINGFSTGANRGNIKISGGLDPDTGDLLVYAAVADSGGQLLELRKSTDSGNAWGATVTPPVNYLRTQGWYDSTIAANPADGNFVFVGGLDIVLRSINGGTAWTDISVDAAGNGPHVDHHGMAVDTLGRLIDGNDGGVWIFDRTSSAWTNANGNLAVTTFNGIATHPTDATIAFGGSQDNGTEMFSDSLGWTHVDGGDGGLVKMDQNNPNNIYHVLNGELRRSLTGGGTGSWTTVFDATAGGLYFPFLLDSVNTSRLLLGTVPNPFAVPQAFSMQESLDQGSTWLNITGDLPGSYNVRALSAATYQGTFNNAGFPLVTDKGSNTYDPDTIYVTDGASIFVTKNHGTTWVDRTEVLGGIQGRIIDIQVDPTNRDTAYALVDGFTAAKLFKTTSAGVSVGGQDAWVDITNNLPNVPSYKLVIDARTGSLYVGNDNGVYRSSNGGATWSRFGVGLPGVQAKDMVLNQDLNTLAIGSYGRSMYQIWLDDSKPNAGVLRSLSGSAVWTGPVFLAGDTTIGAAGNQAVQDGFANARLNIVGTIANAAGLPSGTNPKLNKIGLGNVILSGANTYTGITEVKEGVLSVQNASALGKNPSNGGFGTIVNPGTALHLHSNLTGEPLDLSGDGFSYNGHFAGALRNVSNNNTYTGTITLQTDSTIGVDSGTSLTINSTGTGKIDDVSNSFSLTKELTGTLYLGGANTYDGVTTVNQGRLVVINPLSLGSVDGGTSVIDGAQMQLQGGITVVGEALELSGSGVFGTGALLGIGGNNTWRGPITLAGVPGFSPATVPPINVLIGLDSDPGSTETLTLDGVIDDGAGAFGLTKIGFGTLVLTRDNSYEGLTSVAGGTLRILAGGALGATSGGVIVYSGSTLELDGGISGIAVGDEPLTLNGNGLLPAGNAGSLRSLSGNNSWAGAVTLATGSNTINVLAGELDISGLVQDLGSPNPAAGLTKIGAGRLELDAVNTYRGVTTISTGELQVDGSIGNVSLAGGTLSGRGTVGNVTSTTGTINPGDNGAADPDTLSTGTVSWGAGRTLFVNLADTGNYDRLAVTGNISLAGVTLAGAAGAGVNLDDQFTILTTTGGVISGTFANAASTVFLGGAKFTVDYSDPTKVVLTRNGTTVVTMSASSSANPASFGQIITFTATLTPEAGAGLLNGQSVTFMLDGNAGDIQTGIVTNNVASISSTAFAAWPLSVGTHTIALSFNNAGFTPASASITQVVNKASTSTSVAAVPSTAGYGQMVTFTATVLPSGGNPAPLVGQTVTFKDGATVLGSGALDAAGKATLATDLLIVGGHSITAVYAGDANYNASTSAILSFTVNKSGTASAVTLASPASPSTFGQAVTFTATVESTVGKFLPTGTVTFKDGSTTLGTGTLFDVGGVATATFTTGAAQLNAGTHTITATYSGDANFVVSTSPNFIHVVNQAASTATITQSSPNPSGLGSPVTFTVTVTPTLGGVLPTGTLFLQDGGATLGTTSALVNVGGVATATFTTTPNQLAGGAHVITAVYGGDVNYSGDTSDDFNHLVLKASNTSIGTSGTPTVFGQSMTFTANVTGLNGTPTGTVTFAIDGNNASTVPFSGVPVTFTPATPIDAGSHTVTATYSGDANFGGSSASVSQTVNQAGSTTVLSSSGSPTTFGQTVTFTATVTAVSPGSGTPSGLVTFKEGAAIVGTASLNGSGVATLDVITLGVGSHNITAIYNVAGTGNHATSPLSNTVVQVVSKAATSTSVASALNPSVFGESVTFTATVTPTVGSPAALAGQTVTFKDGAATIGTGTLNASGQATLATATLIVGSHSITAVYAGDANSAGSTSPAISQVVSQATTTTAITSAPSSTIFGQSVTFTATVSLASGAASLNGQTVTFKEGAATLGTGSLNSGGVATFSTSALGAGSHDITAVYGGNSNIAGSQGTQTYTVSQAGTTTLLTSVSPNPSGVGQTVSFTATVSITAPGGGSLSGQTVTFMDGASAMGTGTIGVGGSATFSTSSLSAGTHAITAVFAGSANYIGSASSPAVNLKVAINTTTSVISSANPAFLGAAVTFTATVTPTSNLAGLVGQTVTFSDGATVIGTGTINGSGQATLTTSSLAKGTHAISASYAGDSTFNGSASSTISQSIVLPASALSAVISTQSVKLYTPFSITVNAIDSTGAIVPSYTGTATMTIVSSPFGAPVSGPTVASFVNGVARFNNLFATATGYYTLRFTSSTGLVTEVTFYASLFGRGG